MTGTAFALTAVAIAAPFISAMVAALDRRQVRAIGFGAAAVSVLASAFLLKGAPPRESLDEALMVLFTTRVMGGMLIIPRRDCTSGTNSAMLVMLCSA